MESKKQKRRKNELYKKINRICRKFWMGKN